MTIYLEKSGLFGYSGVDSNKISSTQSSYSTLKGDGAGTYRFYLRYWGAGKVAGNIDVTYSW
ncbi:hypothetical protein [Paenibacillus yonginensis]|uniref:hypothetical protein n=1 Tax=Paenibacillus yonginensis TaxID=1462996 RepID=UPI0012447DAA|nr:hypothetical protein [Paenibacillus yonginensis]